MVISVSDLRQIPSFSLLLGCFCGALLIHAWIAHRGSSLLCVNVEPFCPMLFKTKASVHSFHYNTETLVSNQTQQSIVMVLLGFYIIIRWCALLYHSSLPYNTVLWYLCPGVPNIDLTRNETHSVFFNFDFNFLKNKGK